MTKDFHLKPFDDGTLCKLSIYRDYLTEWLPVFLRETRRWSRVNVLDLFSGPGKDCKGNLGSPLLAIKELWNYNQTIKNSGIKFTLFLNEFDQGKFENLKQEVEDHISGKIFYEIIFRNQDFESVFDETCLLMKNAANLVFLDPTGVKHVTKEIFQKIISFGSGTDLLFFIPSSFVRRFGDESEFKQYLPVDFKQLKCGHYFDIHRQIVQIYREFIPARCEYYLAPFSIKKQSNIYGLVFGSSNLLGLDKFLRVCWKEDTQRGEANFDIDEDNINSDEPPLFEGFDRPKKLNKFNNQLIEEILSKKIRTDFEVYRFALFSGFLPKHVREVIKKMEKEKKIAQDKREQRLIYSYKSKKSPRKIELLNNG